MPINIILPAVLALLLFGAGTWTGYEFATGQQAKQERLVAKVQEAAAQSTAQEIAKIQITNTTIRQEVLRETVEKPVYTDCRHTPDGLQLVNDALRGFRISDGDLR